MDFLDIVVAGIGVIVAAFVITIVVLLLTGKIHCPKGQELVQTGTTVISTGKSITVIPEFACETSR